MKKTLKNVFTIATLDSYIAEYGMDAVMDIIRQNVPVIERYEFVTDIWPCADAQWGYYTRDAYIDIHADGGVFVHDETGTSYQMLTEEEIDDLIFRYTMEERELYLANGITI